MTTNERLQPMVHRCANLVRQNLRFLLFVENPQPYKRKDREVRREQILRDLRVLCVSNLRQFVRPAE